MDAAQLALLRLLWLQRLTRNSVSMRRDEDAVLLARAAIETCIVGLYCVYSGHAIAQLPADLNIRDLALWLEREHRLVVATGLYHRYYVPLSRLFATADAAALMRHVGPDGTLHRRPDLPWLRRSAARMADGCAALLAASIADMAGSPSAVFHRSAAAHLDRLLTPALVSAVKAAFRSGPRREFPHKLQSIIEAQRAADQAAMLSAGSKSGYIRPARGEVASEAGHSGEGGRP